MPNTSGTNGNGSEAEGGGTALAIVPIEIQEEMERSFLEYSMSVIVQRALPDVRDGLKPVHRRILYTMGTEGLRPDRPFVKCARVVGDVMGRFHPHGDSAIYDALARMVQAFSLRHPLVEGHGDFGAPGPNMGPAAARYTECRLAPLAMVLLDGIDEETVDMIPNYDSSDEQPVVLPARFPNLLVNGSQGIAVGMATNIPPHNLGEVIDATIHYLDHPESTPDELMQFVKAPDFPTGALILGRAGILDAYRTGRGSVKMRAVAEIQEGKNGKDQIVVSEIPYQTSIEGISTRIAEAVESGDITGIDGLEEPVRRRHHRARHHVEARRECERDPQQPLQVHADADELRRAHAGARRRCAATAQLGAGHRRLRRSPGRGRYPPFGVPPKARPRPSPHRRGTAPRHRHARRCHRRHPSF